MAYKLTQRAKIISEGGNLEPNIILEIEGYPFKLGLVATYKAPRFGDDIYFGETGLYFGGLIKVKDIKDYIDKDGTTDTINQQLDPDKGSVSSIQVVTLRITDINQEITALISPSFVLDEILYKNCKIWLGDIKGSFPEDYLEVFNGKMQGVKAGPGYIDLTIAHPDDITRGDVFVKAETILTERLNYYSATIEDLFYQNRSDVSVAVSVVYQHSGGLGDNANISVVGNVIYVTIDTSATKAKTIRKKLEDSIDAMQLVSVKITGNSDDIQTYVGTTNLTVDTTVKVEDASLFLTPLSPIFKTYCRIGDEIIEYTGIDLNNNHLTGCTRAALTSLGTIHELDDEVFSFYKLGDGTSNSNAVLLALYLLLSAGPEWYKENITATSINYITPTRTESNAIFYAGKDLVNLYNIQVGDTIRNQSFVNGANNFSSRTITDIETLDIGTIVFVDGASLTTETTSVGNSDFKSQYNILPDGAGLLPNQVDIYQFMYIYNTYFSGLAEYEFYLKDTIKIKDFLNEQVYYPTALYSLPRKGKISVGYTSPPLYADDTKTLDLTTVKNASKLVVNRSVNKNFYNSIVYKYNQDSVEDKYLNGQVTLSQDSINRIKAPNRPLKIESEGLRPNAQNINIININSVRFLGRYQFAAESIPVEVPFGVGWNIEVGDAIIFGDENFNLPDTKNGNRQFQPRIFEITNKSWNWKTSQIKLEILDTGYGLTYRQGTWSPSSIVDAGSTLTKIILKKSYGYIGTYEPEKWKSHVGRSIIIHDDNYLFNYDAQIVGLDTSNPNALVVTGLSTIPAAGYIVEVPLYDDLTVTDELYKQIYPFWTPTLTVVTGISATQFTLSVSDAAKVFVGSIVRVHSEDYATDSGQLVSKKVTNVTGTTITCQDLGFTPSAGQKVDFIGFISDEGIPYVWV